MQRSDSAARPLRDWFMLILFAGLFLLGSLGWNIWFFIHVTSGEAVTAQQVAPRTPEKQLISSLEEVYATRAAEGARYRDTYQFVDPSK